MANKHEKKSPTSFPIREIQIKSMLRFSLTLVRIVIMKNEHINSWIQLRSDSEHKDSSTETHKTEKNMERKKESTNASSCRITTKGNICRVFPLLPTEENRETRKEKYLEQ